MGTSRRRVSRGWSWIRGVCVAALTAAIGLAVLAPLEDVYGPGILYWLRGPARPPSDVVVVAIDRATMEWAAEKSGQPELPRVLPRALHAGLIDALAADGARAIVFDLLFAAETKDDESLSDAIHRAATPPPENPE